MVNVVNVFEDQLYQTCLFGLYNEKYPEFNNLEMAEAIIKTVKNMERKTKPEDNFSKDLIECINEEISSLIEYDEDFKKLKDTDVIKALIGNAERFMYKWELEEELDSYIQKILKEKEEYRQYLAPSDIMKVLYKLAFGYSYG